MVTTDLQANTPMVFANGRILIYAMFTAGCSGLFTITANMPRLYKFMAQLPGKCYVSYITIKRIK